MPLHLNGFISILGLPCKQIRARISKDTYCTPSEPMMRFIRPLADRSPFTPPLHPPLEQKHSKGVTFSLALARRRHKSALCCELPLPDEVQKRHADASLAESSVLLLNSGSDYQHTREPLNGRPKTLVEGAQLHKALPAYQRGGEVWRARARTRSLTPKPQCNLQWK